MTEKVRKGKGKGTAMQSHKNTQTRTILPRSLGSQRTPNCFPDETKLISSLNYDNCAQIRLSHIGTLN